MNSKNLLLAILATVAISQAAFAYQHRFYNYWKNRVLITVDLAAASNNEWEIEPDGGTDWDDVGGLCTNHFKVYDLDAKKWVRSKFIHTNRRIEEFPASQDANNVPETGCHGYTVTVVPDPKWSNTEPIAIISR